MVRPALRVGPVAQWLEPAAHNGLVAGSSPARPTNHLTSQVRDAPAKSNNALTQAENFPVAILGRPTPSAGIAEHCWYGLTVVPTLLLVRPTAGPIRAERAGN